MLAAVETSTNHPIEESHNGMAETTVDIATATKLQTVLKVGSFELTSRLVVGTGKYDSYADMAECLDASGTDCLPWQCVASGF